MASLPIGAATRALLFNPASLVGQGGYELSKAGANMVAANPGQFAGSVDPVFGPGANIMQASASGAAPPPDPWGHWLMSKALPALKGAASHIFPPMGNSATAAPVPAPQQPSSAVPGAADAASAAGIPLPTPRPYTGDYGWGNSDPYGGGGAAALAANPQVRQAANSAGISVPMPQPRPPQAPQPQAPQSYFSGPGAMNFGAGDSPSGNLYGQNLGPQGATGPDLIKKFMDYLHTQGPTGSGTPGASGFASGFGGGPWAPDLG